MDQQKELYRLWYEYLKRSEAYKRLCEYMRAKHEDKSLPVPEEFRKRSDGSIPRLVGEYFRFGDIHSWPFDEWWTWKRERLAYNEKRIKPGPVQDYISGKESVEIDLDACLDAFKRFEGREPTADEMKKYFLQIMQQTAREQHQLFLRVDLTAKPQKIRDGFNAILKEPEVKARLDQGKKWHEYWHGITGKPRLDELQLYLDVYDMWLEKVHGRKPGDPGGWWQIIAHFALNQHGYDDTVERQYKRYKTKATAIIRNVEQGVFPGPY